MTVSRSLALWVIVSCLAMVGCEPLFSEALSTEDDSVIDERLKGKWIATYDNSEPSFEIAFSSNDIKKSLTITFADPTESDEAGVRTETQLEC